MQPRVRAAVSLYVFATLGVFLLAAPWSAIWDFATSFLLPTSLGGWIRSGWARGAVSGLGALDLLAAIQEVDRLRKILGGGTQLDPSDR